MKKQLKSLLKLIVLSGMLVLSLSSYAVSSIHGQWRHNRTSEKTKDRHQITIPEL